MADVGLDRARSSAAPPDHEAPAPSRRWWWGVDGGRIVLVATALALVPFVVAAVAALVRDPFAIHGDGALIELRVRDVGGPHTPLLGSYQRFGFRMPGPLLFYLLAPPYRLLGSDFAGLQVGAALIGAASVAGVALVVHRRAGPVPALWALAVVAVLVRAMGPLGISDPWEPRVTMLPFLLLVLLTAFVASGRSGVGWALPLAAAVGTLLVQSQATLAPTVVAVLALAGVATLVRHRHATGGVRPALVALRRSLALTAGVLAVLWLPPLVHELTADVSNVAEMLAFVRSEQEHLGLGDAVAALSLQLGVPALWMTGETPLEFHTRTVVLAGAPVPPVALVLLAVPTVLAARRRATTGAVLGATVLVVLAIGAVVLSRLVGGLFDWILYWTWPLGAACWMAIGVATWRSLPEGWQRRLELPVAGACLAVVTALGAAVSWAAPRAELREPQRIRDAVVEVAEPTVEALLGVDGPVHVRSDAVVPERFQFTNVGIQSMALALERRGFAARVDDGYADQFGTHRTADDAVAEVYLVTDGGRSAGPGYEVVATVDPVGDERDDLAALERELRQRGADDLTPADLAGRSEDDALARMVDRRARLRDYPELTVLVRR